MQNIYNSLIIGADKSLEERTSEILKKLDDYMLFDELHESKKNQSERVP